MVVHFPDIALRFVDETITDRRGTRWILTTRPSYDSRQNVYILQATLIEGDRTLNGWFRIRGSVVQELEADGDLRVFALRAIKKQLDRTPPVEGGFNVELPYPG